MRERTFPQAMTQSEKVIEGLRLRVIGPANPRFAKHSRHEEFVRFHPTRYRTRPSVEPQRPWPHARFQSSATRTRRREGSPLRGLGLVDQPHLRGQSGRMGTV